jgi:hypothetical protein
MAAQNNPNPCCTSMSDHARPHEVRDDPWRDGESRLQPHCRPTISAPRGRLIGKISTIEQTITAKGENFNKNSRGTSPPAEWRELPVAACRPRITRSTGPIDDRSGIHPVARNGDEQRCSTTTDANSSIANQL